MVPFINGTLKGPLYYLGTMDPSGVGQKDLRVPVVGQVQILQLPQLT